MAATATNIQIEVPEDVLVTSGGTAPLLSGLSAGSTGMAIAA